MSKAHIERREICLLKDVIRKLFTKKIIELVDTGIQNL